MIIYQPEGHGCAYSIDSEGTLYFSPIECDGTLNTTDWDFVESVDELDEEFLTEIQNKLISFEKTNGTYFTV